MRLGECLHPGYLTMGRNLLPCRAETWHSSCLVCDLKMLKDYYHFQLLSLHCQVLMMRRLLLQTFFVFFWSWERCSKGKRQNPCNNIFYLLLLILNEVVVEDFMYPKILFESTDAHDKIKNIR